MLINENKKFHEKSIFYTCKHYLYYKFNYNCKHQHKYNFKVLLTLFTIANTPNMWTVKVMIDPVLF